MSDVAPVPQWHWALDTVREREHLSGTRAESAPVGLWMTDADGRCTYVSNYWRQLTGRDPEQALDLAWVESLHPNDRERAEQALFEAAKSVRLFKGEYRVKRENGEYAWLSVYGAPHFHDDGSYAGHIGACWDITEYKNRESEGHRILDNLLLGQEAERKRVARELHDDIGQRVALSCIALDEIESLVPSTSPILREKLQAVRHEVDLLASAIHRLSHNLHPATLARLGLVTSLTQLCREVSERTHISVECHCGQIQSSMSEDVALALLRVSQESLTNIVKHSKSREARVSLSETRGEVCLTVMDRGVGFDVSRVRPNSGLGLISIQERARMIGANVEIRSTPSRGTTVELRVPTSTIRSAVP